MASAKPDFALPPQTVLHARYLLGDTLGGGVTGIQDYPKLYAALAARGYDEPLLSALFSGNWLRVLPKE